MVNATVVNHKIKRIISLLCAIVLVMGIMVGCTNDENGDSTSNGAFEGTYSLSIGGIGSSFYTFRENGTGVRSYSVDENENTEEFDYTVTNKSITFTWKDSGKTESHSFVTGKADGRNVIWINDVIYYKQ